MYTGHFFGEKMFYKYDLMPYDVPQVTILCNESNLGL